MGKKSRERYQQAAVPLTRSRRLAFTAVTVTGATLAGILALGLVVEAVFYLKDPAGYASRYNVSTQERRIFDGGIGVAFRDDPVLPFGMNPGVYKLTNGRQITINSQGYRGPEFTREKPAGRKRVLVLGDSFIYGFGVGDEHTVPRQLEGVLKKKLPDVEVINAGFHGSSPIQYDLYLRKEGFALKPDVIVLPLLADNDLADMNSSFTEREDAAGLPDKIVDGLTAYQGRRYYEELPASLINLPVLGKSVLWFKLLKSMHFLGTKREFKAEPTFEDISNYFDRWVLHILSESKTRGIPVVPWIMIGRTTFDKGGREFKPYWYMQNLLRKNGLEFVDMGDVLLGRTPAEICLPAGDIHLNETGNSLVAARGAREIEKLLTSAR